MQLGRLPLCQLSYSRPSPDRVDPGVLASPVRLRAHRRDGGRDRHTECTTGRGGASDAVRQPSAQPQAVSRLHCGRRHGTSRAMALLALRRAADDRRGRPGPADASASRIEDIRRDGAVCDRGWPRPRTRRMLAASDARPRRRSPRTPPCRHPVLDRSSPRLTRTWQWGRPTLSRGVPQLAPDPSGPEAGRWSTAALWPAVSVAIELGVRETAIRGDPGVPA